MSKLDEKYYPGRLCTCAARAEIECCCNADWTPKEVYQQSQRIKELEAHVERLREFVQDCTEWTGSIGDNAELMLRETPAQSQREVRAEAVEGLLKSDLVEFGGVLNYDDVDDYAKQLRNGGE